MGGKETKIASIYTVSELTPSKWGDQHLFFRHQRMDDDLVFRPEWTQYVPKYGGFFSLEEEINALDNHRDQSLFNGCPFANFMLNLNQD